MALITRTCTLQDLDPQVRQLAQGYLTADDSVRVCYETLATREGTGTAVRGLLIGGSLPKPSYYATVVTGTALISTARVYELASGSFKEHANAIQIEQVDLGGVQLTTQEAYWGSLEHRVDCPLGGFRRIDFVFSQAQEAMQFVAYLRLIVGWSRAGGPSPQSTRPHPPVIGTTTPSSR